MRAQDTKGFKKWEFPKGSKIWIREFFNVNEGEAFNGSYLVTIPAKVTGTGRKRRQFKELAKAKKWASEELRGATKQGEDYFKAEADERRQFIEILPELRKHNLSLRELLDFAIPRLRPEGGNRTVADLVEEMLESKQARFEKGQLRELTVLAFRSRAKRFSEHFGDSLLRDLKSPDLKAWFKSLEVSTRSTKNYMAVVSEILRHAKQSKLILESPLDSFTDMERKELFGNSDESKEPGILSVSEAQRLLESARELSDLGLLASITLGLFCGLRTEELKRLDWADIHLDDDSPFVTVGPKIAKKRRIRNVDIPPNAVEWLSICRNVSGKIVTNSYMAYIYRGLKKILEHAGIGKRAKDGKFLIKWENNSMRHSFGTYHFALHGNSMETARLLGHKSNDQVLFDHYRALAKKEDGRKFFEIKPAASAVKVVEFSR